MVKEIIWDRAPVIEIQEKPFFRKIKNFVNSVEKKVGDVHPVIKWLIAIFIGGLLAKLLDIALSTYFIYGFESFSQVNLAFRVQFVIDLIFVIIIVILVAIIIKMSRRR